MTGAVALFLFVLFAAAVAFAARGVGRPIGRVELSAFFLFAVAFLAPGFFSRRTILPVDHAMLLTPWSHMAAVTRYNANLNDVVTQMAPWNKAVRMAWKEGSLPLRNRWNGSGMALAGNGQSAAFSPFTFLMFPLPLWAGYTLAVAAKLFLALTGISLWLRELSVSRGSAAFGAMLFGLSFAITPWLLFPHSAVLCLWPWALFAIERLRDGQARPRAWLLLMAVFTVWPLCGHPESIVLAALFTAVWLAIRGVLGDLPDGLALVRRVALAAAAAVGLSAFLLVPEALAIAASNRIRVATAFWSALPFSVSPHGPRWPGGFVTTLLPRAFGDAIHSPTIAGGAGPFPEMGLGFFGLVGASVAFGILRPGSRRRRTAVAFAVPLLLGLFIATGVWPFFELFLHVPGLKLMFALRYLSWVALAGAAIAAFEADRLRRDILRTRLAAAGAIVPAVALALFALWTYRRLAPLHAAAGGLPSQRRALFFALLAAGAAVLVAAAAATHPALARALPVLLAAAATAELAAQGARLYRFGPPENLFPETPLLRFLHSQPPPFRVVGEGSVLFPSSNVFAGLEDIRTHDPVEREDYVDFLDRAAGYAPADYFKRLKDWNAPALDLLNVRYLVGEPGWAAPGEKWKPVYRGSDGVVFENASALPRVFGAARLSPSARDSSDGFALTEYREETNAISFRARVTAGAGPVRAVASVVDDGGWSALDETGRDLAIGRARGILLLLSLPPGEHTIRLRYRPPGFAAGLALSLATAVTLVLVTAVMAVTARRRRRPRHSPASGSG